MKTAQHRITLISDTHTKHEGLRLPGGDILIHAGDIMNSGRDIKDVKRFLTWFESQDYKNLIFIAGNHDRMFQTHKDAVSELLEQYPSITYLQDESVTINGINIYCSP